MVNENIWGHKKKLGFIISAINEYCSINNHYGLDEFRILDVGCGNGTAVTFHIADLGVNVVGIDIHQPSIEYAISHNQHDNLCFKCERVEDLKKSEKFDIVICSDILEHLIYPCSTLAHIHEIIKDNGILVISIPNGFGPFEIEKFVFERSGLLDVVLIILLKISGIKRALLGKENNRPNPERLPYNSESGHVQHFTMKRFIMLLEKTGFKAAKVENGCFMGASLSNLLFGKYPSFISWNVAIADRLPYCVASTWYFVAIKVQ
jgi:SAM-dependent methyltransferase